jgi:hypothetical protein
VLSLEPVPPVATGLAGVDRCRGLATKDVHPPGDRLEVFRVDASGVAAQVVEVEALGDRASGDLVAGAVGAEQLAAAGGIEARPDLAVALPE